MGRIQYRLCADCPHLRAMREASGLGQGAALMLLLDAQAAGKSIFRGKPGLLCGAGAGTAVLSGGRRVSRARARAFLAGMEPYCLRCANPRGFNIINIRGLA